MKKLITAAALMITAISPAMAEITIGQPKLLSDQMGFAEGPIWHAQKQAFLFTDIPNQTIYSASLDGKISAIDQQSGFANGLAVDQKGNIWSARHDRKLSLTNPKGEKTVMAATYAGKPLNSPNDLIIDDQGAVWFTDPPFGIQGYGPQKAPEEQPARGIYRYKDGALTLENGDLKLPNGIAFSPDNHYLYVADTADGWVYRFNVRDSHLSNKQAFARVDVTGKEPMADGVETDRNGNVYIAGPGGVGIFNDQGKQLHYIAIDSGHISNIALGGQHQEYLLVTAANKVLLYPID